MVHAPVEFLNSLTISDIPPYILNFKVGTVNMLLQNLNTKRDLCNGTRLKVTKLSVNLICTTILTSTAKGSRVVPVDADLSLGIGSFL